MAATYNPTTERITLAGDNAGWSRLSSVLPVVPFGVNQMIILLRYWTTNNTSSVNEVNAWNPAHYVGFNFNGGHIDDTNPESLFDDWFGLASFDGSSPFTQAGLDVAAGQEVGMLTPLSLNYHKVFSGNSSQLSFGSVANAADRPWGIAKTEALGLQNTLGIRVFGSTIDDTVSVHTWLNEDSLDLSTIDMSKASDMDPENPTVSVPVSGAQERTEQIHGDVNGTNWRPSAGVMAFPGYFMARYPVSLYQFDLANIKVQYSRLEIA